MSVTHDLHTERLVLEEFIAQPRWSRAGLKVKLEHIDPELVDGALVGLLVKGLLIRDGAQTWLLAPCVPHLDTLGVLAPTSPNGSPPKGPDRETVDRILAAHRQAE